MRNLRTYLFPAAVCAALLLALAAQVVADDVVRPEEVRSLREVVYDRDTYNRLADMWKAYNDAYPSEFAYANWMFAARYSGDEEYGELLAKGLKKYPANPKLLYLNAQRRAGSHDDRQAIQDLEKAAALDKSFIDPWFDLIPRYMDAGDEGHLDLALRHVLESGAITDEIMDYNYNMLIGLEPNAILITNGDNDTFPGWILTRILQVRPDVTIINRALLNAEWYPLYTIAHGAPRFVNAASLTKLREDMSKKLAETGAFSKMTPSGPYGDTLIQRIVESADLAGRPVYLARTIIVTDPLRDLIDHGRSLGLAIRVGQSDGDYVDQLQTVYGRWLHEFRTDGLRSWRLRYTGDSDAGRLLVANYAYAIMADLAALRKLSPDPRVDLFHWYLANMQPILPEMKQDHLARAWNRDASDIAEIQSWCAKQGLD